MEFKDLAGNFGIENYPEKLDEIYCNLPKETNFCDLDELNKYEVLYNLLGEYYDIAQKGAKEILNDKNLFAYGKTVCEYIKSSTTFQARSVPMPEPDGTPARDMFRLHVMLSLMPSCEEFYKGRGYTNEQIAKHLKGIKGCLSLVEKDIGRPAMTYVFYDWELLYLFGEIFDYGSFNFQLKEFFGGAIILKNKKNSEYVPMMIENTFHRNGQVLGNILSEDPEGSFEADFSETDEFYSGHLVYNGRTSAEISVCSKDEWECVLKPREYVLSVHIPTKTDLSPEAVEKSIREGFELAKEIFPDYKLKCPVCYSWLMDPTLNELLGSESKIAMFGNAFLRFPVKCPQNQYWGNIFPGYHGPIKTAPENTTLQRKLKELYLSGKNLYTVGAVYTKLM